MLSVDSINKGIVIDHIEAQNSMAIYKLLGLDKLENSIAILKNVKSEKNSKKDIIKIENIIDIDLEILGYIAPNVTVNIIENGKIKEKKTIEIPMMVQNVVKCKNPRCITSIEQEIVHKFRLIDRENKVYSCVYCEQKNN